MEEIVLVIAHIHLVHLFHVFMDQLDCALEDFCGSSDLLRFRRRKPEQCEEITGFFGRRKQPLDAGVQSSVYIAYGFRD